MRKANFLLTVVALLFSPFVVFACFDSEGGYGIDQTFLISSMAILSYFYITGFIYLKNYKKLIDRKWGFMQYAVFLIVIVSGLIFLPSIISTLLGRYEFYLYTRDSIANPGVAPYLYNYNLNSTGTIIFISAIVALAVLFPPLVANKRWVYVWGIPIYLVLLAAGSLFWFFYYQGNTLCF